MHFEANQRQEQAHSVRSGWELCSKRRQGKRRAMERRYRPPEAGNALIVDNCHVPTL